MVGVAGTWAGSYVGNWIENLVDSGGNWVDETEKVLVWKLLPWLLRTD